MYSILFNYTLTASSVSIDGYHNGVEWDGATVTQLLNGESNCNVNFGLVKTLINSKESAVYLCFMFIDPSLEIGNESVGVSIEVDNSDLYTLIAADSPAYFDTSDYVFDGALSIDENNGANCEIRVGFKNGLSKEIPVRIRFIDSNGAQSNVYHFIIINTQYSETTELLISETESETETEKETKAETTRAPKTTKEKTTKVKTTKEKTTKEKTTKEKTTKYKTTTEKEERKTDYTLKQRTTQAEKKKTEFHIQTSPPYSYVRKTKANKTTAAHKTTVSPKPKTTKQKSATVYYYEKEIIISHVYVTSETTAFTENNFSESATPISSALQTSADEFHTEKSDKVSLSDGTKYKIIVGVSAALAFIALAFASSKSANKKSENNSNKTDSQ